MSNCTECILDLTDACPRGSGRAIDDEICDSFIPRETYEVNKNESWQLGYQQGKSDAFAKCKLDNGEYCWQECCATEHCLECLWLDNSDICYFDNTFITNNLEYADMPTTP